MSLIQTLPLGIDIGATRIRIACMEKHPRGETRLRAVVGRELPDIGESGDDPSRAQLITALIEEMLSELGLRERRCILALGMPWAILRTTNLPRMTRGERIRAARFEAQRFAPWDLDLEPSYVRAHRVEGDAGLWAIGAARVGAVESRVALVRAAGLRAICVDHDTLALERALGADRAIVDIGSTRSTVHTPSGQGLSSRMIPLGGDLVTRGIARELSIDFASAERRKRILGVAGAGLASRKELVAQLVALLERVRGTITSIALTGNGARLPGIAAELEAATGALTGIPVADAMLGDAYPDDVLRSASPDWTLAVGLAMRSIAA